LAGIYIHIPFCKKACHYCDFHFSTSLKNKDAMVDAICKEIELRKDYVGTKEISTLYFGGGTPSLLNYSDIISIISKIKTHFVLTQDIEITLEANPDDLDKEKIAELKAAGINRLSIGVQSFFDEDLLLMNRSHTSEQAITAICEAKKAGFNNISIDLIYGLPNLTIERWKNNLQKAFELDVPHLSSYSLTVEKRTALYNFVQKKKIILPDESLVIEQFGLLMEEAKKNGFIHYEISNFCKDGMYSKHNSSYWKNEYYLGIGPSAHSYNGSSRQWNISSNALYIDKIKNRDTWFEKEELSEEDRFNEYVMTRLRTIWGIDMDFVKSNFGEDTFKLLLQQSQPYIASGHLQHEEENVFLTQKGKLLADKIAAELFI
jgi:oxygen-independent coproporphyrinogen-3 oxidase